MEVIPKRMNKYGLTVHPEKTRLIRFQRDDPVDSDTADGKEPSPKTFAFLGFTNHWGRARIGRWVIKRKMSNRGSSVATLLSLAQIVSMIFSRTSFDGRNSSSGKSASGVGVVFCMLTKSLRFEFT
jgi:hypothetical protein